MKSSRCHSEFETPSKGNLMSNITPLIDDLKFGDAQQKQYALQQLEKLHDEAISHLIDAIATVQASDVYWTLDGFDFNEEVIRKGYHSPFDLIQDTVKYRCWYVPAAVRLLIKCGKSAVPPLELLLNSDRPPVRTLAAYALGEIGNQSASAHLIERLDTSDLEELSRSIEALGKLRAKESVDRLIQLLPIANLTFEVAVALGRIHDSRALLPLAQQLKNQSSASHAVAAAISTFGPPAVEPVLNVLADQNAFYNHHLAVEVLGILGDNRAINPIIDILSATSNTKIEDNAVIALGKLNAKEALPYMVKIFKTTADINLRYHAMKAIAAIGGESAFNIFVTFIENGSFELRCLSLVGLASIEYLGNIHPLMVALQDEDPRIRATAAVQLANLHDPRTVDALKAACNDSDWQTRNWATEALNRIEQQSKGLDFG